MRGDEHRRRLLSSARRNRRKETLKCAYGPVDIIDCVACRDEKPDARQLLRYAHLNNRRRVYSMFEQES